MKNSLLLILIFIFCAAFGGGGGSLKKSDPLRTVIMDDLANCLISKSGGGDSGGGAPGQLPRSKPLLPPSTDPLQGNRDKNGPLDPDRRDSPIWDARNALIHVSSTNDRNQRDLIDEEELSTIYGPGVLDLSFNVIDLLSCRMNDGLFPTNLKVVLKVIDREIQVFKKYGEEQGWNPDYLTFLIELRASLYGYEEI